jgi:peptide/nickel transport system ATP-binding protein
MDSHLLTITDLHTQIGRGERAVRAVDGLSLHVDRGETFALLGESGCGKSITALSILRLLPQPAGRITGGSIRLNGQDLAVLPEVEMRDIRGARIAMIFQEPMTSLNPVLTIGEQIRESLRRHRHLRGRAARRRVLELLDAVGIPDAGRRYGEYPHQLSGGMKQRVMIAIALAGEPDLLIADEPTTALDVTIQAQVLDLLRDLQRETGMAIFLITHDLGVVAEMADRVAVMYAGQIVEQARRDSFFSNPQHPYSRKLFEALPDVSKRRHALTVIPGSVPSLDHEIPGCRFASRCDRAWSRCTHKVPPWVNVGKEHGASCHLLDPGIVPPEPSQLERRLESVERGADIRGIITDLLVTKDLKVYFPIQRGIFKRVVGQVRAVDGISMHIPVGRTLALVGESGCGKTTAGKGILQLIRPTSGTVLFDGTDLRRLGGRALRRRRSEFQIIFQDPYSSMNPRMMIRDIVEEGMRAQHIGGSKRERGQRVVRLLEQVGLSPEHGRRYPHEFSGGQRQRICIARALAVNPRLLICDEPTSALDVSVQAQILNLLKRLQNELGLSYLFITHNISVVSYLADRVAVMYLGRIVEEGEVGEVLERPLHPYTQALLSAVPQIDPETRREVIRLEGDLPSPANPPRGCHFHPRCPHVMPECRLRYPSPTLVGGHRVNCFLHG